MPSNSDPRRGPKQPMNAWALLNKPIAFNSIVELLGKDVDLISRKDDGLMVDFDQQADALIERATLLAEETGISIEEALEQIGIAVVGEGGERADSDQAEMRNSMLKTLDWEISHGDDEDSSGGDGGMQWVRRSSEILDHLDEYLGNIERDMLVDVLDLVVPSDLRLRRRLVFLEFCTDDEFIKFERRHKSEGGEFWRVLLSVENSDLDLFAEALLGMPFAPIVVEDMEPFSDWLLENKHIEYSLFKSVRAEAKKSAIGVCHLLREEQYLGEEKYLKLVEKYSGLKIWEKAVPRQSKKLLDLVDRSWAEYFDMVPLSIKSNVLTVGVLKPSSEYVLARMAEEAEMEIECCLMPAEKLLAARQRLLDKTTPSVASVKTTGYESRVRDMVTSASAVNMVRQLFEGALESRATDIHIDPEEKGARVRFRIDGLLYPVMVMDEGLMGEVASRIKILADLDITERRRPQDGHITVNIHDQEYNMRIATVPIKHGERISIRMVYSGNVMKSMDDLGLINKDYEKVKRCISLPHGMILATGPVGSGKTTTLYSVLNEIDRSVNNVMSIEDPVEFGLEGANQVEVNYDLQFGFVEGLRALLRQDPDAILVGEIRDEETARIAVRASMTGLLVFSTLHTNDAPGAVTALSNFNLPPHLIANSLVGIIAQRLLRKVCTHCKTGYKAPKTEMRRLGFSTAEMNKVKRFYKGKGCEKCFNSGYLGRIGVFEVLEVTPTLRENIQTQASEKVLHATAIRSGMRTLAADGRSKVLSGETTPEEFLRILRP